MNQTSFKSIAIKIITEAKITELSKNNLYLYRTQPSYSDLKNLGIVKQGTI